MERQSCTDHIFVLRQIMVQSHEWKSSLYMVFVDVEKAFNSLHRTSHRKILSSKTEVMDYADHLGLLSHRCQDIQQMTEKLSETASTIGLKVYNKKTQLPRKYASSNTPVTVNQGQLEDAREFVFLGNKMTKDGDCQHQDQHSQSSLCNAQVCLEICWLKLSNQDQDIQSNVFSSILYGSESWMTAITIDQNLEVFKNMCLRCILKIFWPGVISSEDLQNSTI